MPYYRRRAAYGPQGGFFRRAASFVGQRRGWNGAGGYQRKWGAARRGGGTVSYGNNYGTAAKKLTLRGFANTRAELKYFDIVGTQYNANTTPSAGLVNGIAQGDDINMRVGRQIICKFVEIDGLLGSAQVTMSGNLARLMVIWDKNNNSVPTLPLSTDILDASTSIAGTNLNNRDRYVILYDKTWSQAYGTSTTCFGETHYPIKIKVAVNAKTTYSGTGATQASIASGALFVMTIGSNAAGAGGLFTLHTRLRYTDA